MVESREKRLFSGTYQVGVDASHSRFDLFDVKDNISGVEPDKTTHRREPNKTTGRTRAELIKEKLLAKTKGNKKDSVEEILQKLKAGKKEASP